jgi:threonylcarbamoyladenosine tRNA methylthiotransferase MtaB
MSGKRKTVAAITLGCKVNAYDTESMLELFRAAGYAVLDISADSDINNNFDEADVYIINTCSVTAVADKKSRQAARRIAERHPKAIIAVAGCYAQNKTEEALSLPGVHIVAGAKNRALIVDLVENYNRNGGIINGVTGYNKSNGFENLPVSGLEGRTRAFVKIQDGCENFCSYCIIPYVRGPVRSRRIEDIKSEARSVAEAGVKEIVVSGISVASYGVDLDGRLSLADALYAIASAPGAGRIRLSSVGPSAIDEAFLRAYAELPICPHVHLSLQSGCGRTLKRMNRRYTPEDYRRAIYKLRDVKPDTAITTDIITGFPGETEEDFEESMAFVTEQRLAALHVFPYSRRDGTAAAAMDNQVPKAEREGRARRFIRLGEELRRDYKSAFIGSVQDVLFERETDSGVFRGFTPNYIEVTSKFLGNSQSIINNILPVVLAEDYSEIVIRPT